jgi:hypothetical protein
MMMYSRMNVNKLITEKDIENGELLLSVLKMSGTSKMEVAGGWIGRIGELENVLKQDKARLETRKRLLAKLEARKSAVATEERS